MSADLWQLYGIQTTSYGPPPVSPIGVPTDEATCWKAAGLLNVDVCKRIELTVSETNNVTVYEAPELRATCLPLPEPTAGLGAALTVLALLARRRTRCDS